MSVASMILVVVVAFFASLEGILGEFQFHQPLVVCTLISPVTGNLEAGITPGGPLQMIVLGWANIDTAVVPGAALTSVTATIIMAKDGGFATKGIAVATATVIPLAATSLFLTILVRTVSTALVHGADAAAKEGNTAAVERTYLAVLFLQGLRIVVPVAPLLAVPISVVQSALNVMSDRLSDSMAAGGDMVVAVSYAMVISTMAASGVRPLFAIGFAVVAVPDLIFIALDTVGAALAFVYLNLSGKGRNGGGTASGSGDPTGDILEDY